MKITSRAFNDGDRIPKEYTREGTDRSPPLGVEEVPAAARSVALVVDDPDAPGKTWVHWLIWGIPADRGEIPEGVPTEDVVGSLGGARQGTNDFGELGYGGPMPPRGHGTHHYRFTAYALSEAVELDPGAGRAELEAALEGRTLDTARLTATYQRA